MIKKNKNKKLLEEVREDRLKRALDENLSPEEREKAFEEAMKATDRANETKKNWIKVVEVAAIPVALTIVKIAANSRLATRCFKFDTGNTPTSTPGRAFLPSIFRFKD